MYVSTQSEKGWNLQAEYYNKILYPLQDMVIPVFSDTPFYLTGGTALSRGYYNHRYSDDLDYFVNYRPDFMKLSDIQTDKIRKIFNDIKIAVKDKYFYRVFVAGEKLKIEMINDVPSHAGTLMNHPELGLIDSKENILANKLTAVVDRALPKDIVDIYFLLKDALDLKKALTDAESKAAGIAPLLIAKILAEFDYSLISREIKWVNPVSDAKIENFLRNISIRIVKGKL